MADVHKLHIFTVNQVMAVIIYQAVHRPDDLSIRQAAAALAEVHPPDHLGFVPVVVPDFGQNIIGHLAVFQHEAAAILHQVQRKAHFLFPFVADFRILDVHFLVGGGDGLAKEVKAVMEFYLRSGVHQGFDVLLGQLADAFGVVQLHTFQVWQHSQLFRYLPDAIGGQGGQIQLSSLGVVLLAHQFHGTGNVDCFIGSFQLLHLLQGQLRHFQVDELHLRQVHQIFHQCIQGVVSIFQRQLRGVRWEGFSAQVHRIGNCAVRILTLEGFQLGVIMAGRSIQGLQVRKIFAQNVHIFLGQGTDADAFRIAGNFSILERNVPDNLALGKLSVNLVIMVG